VWFRGVARLRDDPWAAALVAQHAIVVYDRARSDPAWAAFFAAMEASRDTLVRTAGHDIGKLERDYVFVRLGDLISLAFCTGWTDAQHYDPWSVQRDGSRVIVTPDPFDVREFPIDVPARELANGSFASDEDLRAALRAAPDMSLHGIAMGG
jgi:hypothetical protein